MWQRTQLSFNEWTSKLVQYFFGAPSGSAEYGRPVRHLAVTNSEIMHAAGNVHASEDAARQDLITVFRNQLQTDQFSLIYRPVGSCPDHLELPQSVVALFISCLVAAEYTTSQTYRTSFDEICGNGKRNDTATLPELWEELQKWLEQCRALGSDYSVRSLLLPPRRTHGWRNISYSLALSFPKRTDRDKIREEFESLAARDPDPSISAMIAALQRIEARFTAGFREFFDDFKHESANRRTHPFWGAMRDAWCEVSGLPPEEELAIRLCASVIDGDVHPYALAREQGTAVRFGFAATEAPHLDETWRFVVTDGEGQPETFVAELLANRTRVPGVTRDVERGVVAFEESSATYVWVGGVPRAGRGAVLVRGDGPTLASLRHLVVGRGGIIPEPRATAFGGWLFASEVCFGADAEDAERLSLLTTPASVRILEGSGVRLRAGFFGHSVFLPHIAADMATRLVASPRDAESVTTELIQEGTSWAFPTQDIHGRWTIQALGENGLLVGSLALEFTDAPAHSEFHAPTTAQRERMLVEGSRTDESTLHEALPLFSLAGDERAFPGDGLVYLGPVVGEFGLEPAPGLDWLADLQNKRLTFVGDPLAPTPSVRRVLGQSAARRWRRCFGQFRVDPLPEGPAQALDAYRRLAKQQNLPRTIAESVAPTAQQFHRGPIPTVAPLPGVEHFRAGLAAVAATRHGIDEAALFQLIDRAFGSLGWSVKWDLIRAWAEAGVLEPARDARWPARRYFVRRPRLVFTDATKRRAVVAGLVTSAVRQRVEAIAAREKRRTEHSRSISPWAPTLLTVDDPAALESTLESGEGFGAAQTVPILDDIIIPVSSLVQRSPRSQHHESGEHTRFWSRELGRFVGASAPPSGEVVCIVQRPGHPDRYDVLSNGSVMWSTHSRTWAFLTALDLRHESPFTFDGRIVSLPSQSQVRLPLGLAQALTFRNASPGPLLGGTYGYCFRDRGDAIAVLGHLLPGLDLPKD